MTQPPTASAPRRPWPVRSRVYPDGMHLVQAQYEGSEVVINYAEGPGNGPPFVVLHGGAGRWQHWQGFLETLAPNWHVFAPDFRGHGGSGHVPGSYLLSDLVRDTAEFLTGVVKQPAVVFGHSLGGEVAVMLAGQHPQLFRGLIVGDAPLSIAQQGVGDPIHRAMNVMWHDLAGRPEVDIAQALRQTPVRVPGSAQPHPAVEVMGEDSPWFAFQAVTLHQLDPDMLAAVLAGPDVMLAGYEPEVLLPRVLCPVLLVQADPEGPLQPGGMTDEEVARGLRLLPNGAHVRLQGVGHPLDQTDVVVAAITPFLDDMRSTRSI